MASQSGPTLRPLQINRAITASDGHGGVPDMPLAVPSSPVAPDRSDPGESPRLPDAHDDLSSALRDLERAYAGVLTHKAGCGIICTCGLDGLNAYLGRKP